MSSRIHPILLLTSTPGPRWEERMAPSSAVTDSYLPLPRRTSEPCFEPRSTRSRIKDNEQWTTPNTMSRSWTRSWEWWGWRGRHLLQSSTRVTQVTVTINIKVILSTVHCQTVLALRWNDLQDVSRWHCHSYWATISTPAHGAGQRPKGAAGIFQGQRHQILRCQIRCYCQALPACSQC